MKRSDFFLVPESSLNVWIPCLFRAFQVLMNQSKIQKLDPERLLLAVFVSLKSDLTSLITCGDQLITEEQPILIEVVLVQD